MANNIVIVGACRTAIGKFGGALAETPVEELGAVVIKEALRRAGLAADQADEVVMGCVLQAARGQNVARQAALRAGLPVETPAETLNIVCGSGLQSVSLAASLIQSGQAEIVVAGGMENMSAAPYLLDKARYGYRLGDGQLIDSVTHDALSDAFNEYHMGITAENVAEKYGLSRQMQDDFAVWSQQKCEKAQSEGKFKDEIAPVPIKRKKETVAFDQDEYPRPGATLESIAGLKPAFKKDGTVTAANASGINDGAAAVVLMSEAKAKENGLKPLARWLGGATAGVDPAVMGIGPAASTRKLLERLNVTLEQIDLIEANEAFAAQALAVGKLLGWDDRKVNVNGGAIALGHPVGASGCRILVTLLYEMRRRQAAKGLATLCVGGGMGVSALVELV
ncbi:MAG: acetyl-CoA C-acetyltransferase [Candidatus Adiutrix sp.]|nr:acetyl-CoA C-acetyltransferase [Candidatus Adiutrix sp.]